MQLNFEKSFLKDIKKLNDKQIASKLQIILHKFENIQNLDEIQNIKKLKGFEIYYRLRIGNYRLGFAYENNEITIIRLLHRKDIYKLFP